MIYDLVSTHACTLVFLVLCSLFNALDSGVFSSRAASLTIVRRTYSSKKVNNNNQQLMCVESRDHFQLFGWCVGAPYRTVRYQVVSQFYFQTDRYWFGRTYQSTRRRFGVSVWSPFGT